VFFERYSHYDKMTITLSVESYRKERVAQNQSVCFDQLGGTIGRATSSGLVLDDASKNISRTHARVDFQNGAYCLTDLGSNPSFVNERPLGNGRHVALGNGDILSIGDYLIRVSISNETAAAPLARSPLQIEPAPLALAHNAPVDNSLADASILNFSGPFDDADPLGMNQFSPQAVVPDGLPVIAESIAPLAFRGAESDHVSPELQAFPQTAPVVQRVPVASATMAIPDDYDPLADFLPPRVVSLNSVSPPPIASGLPIIPELKGSIPAEPVEVPVLSPVLAERQSCAPQSDVAQVPVSESELIEALLRGLGLPELKINCSPAEFAELVGAMLREATGGTMGLLMGRTMTKRESRLDMTMIATQANNPLKFFPDADSALSQMLGNTFPGYIQPVRAYATAFDDLKAHELAILAGMRAALEGVLNRFDPAAIEQRLQVPSVMDKVLISNRKAKMWDRLVALYDEIARDADEDFQRMFGEQFSVAYEEQIARLGQARR
jgi:type VI secretion system FHA domain protein